VVYALLPSLTLRTIDPVVDADLCADNHYAACVASFGDSPRYEGRDVYLDWLREKVVEYPEGFVLAFDDHDRFVGHVELQVPYGLPTGYVNLFYVAPGMRGRGYGRLLHAYAERYFRSWEAERAELHVSPRNIRAIRFYRKIGYSFCDGAGGSYMTRDAKLWKMSKSIEAGTATTNG
jgi:ribosomal protein S18 acetylase RimI-like enzyme